MWAAAASQLPLPLAQLAARLACCSAGQLRAALALLELLLPELSAAVQVQRRHSLALACLAALPWLRAACHCHPRASHQRRAAPLVLALVLLLGALALEFSQCPATAASATSAAAAPLLACQRQAQAPMRFPALGWLRQAQARCHRRCRLGRRPPWVLLLLVQCLQGTLLSRFPQHPLPRQEQEPAQASAQAA